MKAIIACRNLGRWVGGGEYPGPSSSGWFLATPTVRVRHTCERYGKIDLTVFFRELQSRAIGFKFPKKIKKLCFYSKNGLFTVLIHD